MSAILLDQTIAHVRSLFTRAEVAEVRPYAGEFSGEEVDQVSFSCPAVLITVLGWGPDNHGTRLAGRLARDVRLAAFVVTKNASRDKRMAEAMTQAERLSIGLRLWAPDSAGLPITIAGLEVDPACQNLYGRAIDRKGLALWLVDWHQSIRPVVPLPQLYDLLAVDITDHTAQGTGSSAAAPGTPPTVTEDVQFNPLPPAA